MKIEHTDGGVGGATGKGLERAGPGAEQKTTRGLEGGRNSEGDEIALSSLGQRLTELGVQGPAGSERLAALSRQVETGRYEVDVEELSRRLIENMDGK